MVCAIWLFDYFFVPVEDLEEKVRASRRYRRNSLHHTHMLESQMKTVKGELVDTLDHLQELRNVLRRSQQKAEERKAVMEKLAAGLRWATAWPDLTWPADQHPTTCRQSWTEFTQHPHTGEWSHGVEQRDFTSCVGPFALFFLLLRHEAITPHCLRLYSAFYAACLC